jgi:hypothetical protein
MWPDQLTSLHPSGSGSFVWCTPAAVRSDCCTSGCGTAPQCNNKAALNSTALSLQPRSYPVIPNHRSVRARDTKTGLYWRDILNKIVIQKLIKINLWNIAVISTVWRVGNIFCKTTNRIERSWVRFPKVSMEFFIDLILPTALCPWGREFRGGGWWWQGRYASRYCRLQPPLFGSDQLMFSRTHSLAYCSLPGYIRRSHVHSIFFVSFLITRCQILEGRQESPDWWVITERRKCIAPLILAMAAAKRKAKPGTAEWAYQQLTVGWEKL